MVIAKSTKHVYDSIPKTPFHQIRRALALSAALAVCETDLSTWRFDWCCEKEMTKSLVSFFWFICQTSFPGSAWNSRLERRHPRRGEKSRLSCRVYGAYSKHFWLAWRKWNLVESISIRRESGSDAEGKQLRSKGTHWDGINDFYLFWKKAGMRVGEGVTTVLNNFKLCFRTMEGLIRTAEGKEAPLRWKHRLRALRALDAFCRCQQISRCPLNFEFVPGDVNNIARKSIKFSLAFNFNYCKCLGTLPTQRKSLLSSPRISRTMKYYEMTKTGEKNLWWCPTSPGLLRNKWEQFITYKGMGI